MVCCAAVDAWAADKELQRRVDALYSIGQGVTHKFETDSETAYQKAVPTGGKLMSVKSIGGHSEVIDGEIVSAGVTEVVEQGRNLFDVEKCAALGLYYGFEIDTNKTLQIALKDEKNVSDKCVVWNCVCSWQHNGKLADYIEWCQRNYNKF